MEDEDTPLPERETRPGVLLLQSWLNRVVRVRLTDERIVTGTLRCLDGDRNLVLGSANERRAGAGGAPRTIGHVIVPGKHIVAFWVEDLDVV